MRTHDIMTICLVRGPSHGTGALLLLCLITSQPHFRYHYRGCNGRRGGAYLLLGPAGLLDDHPGDVGRLGVRHAHCCVSLQVPGSSSVSAPADTTIHTEPGLPSRRPARAARANPRPGPPSGEQRAQHLCCIEFCNFDIDTFGKLFLQFSIRVLREGFLFEESHIS